MIKKSFQVVAGLLFILFFLAGCQGVFGRNESMLHRNWGKAYETAKTNQILNPQAGEKTQPVFGLDGKAAEGALESYVKSFKGKPADEVYNINLKAGKSYNK